MELLTYHAFSPAAGEMGSPAKALFRVMEQENPEQPYSRMIRFRLEGKASAECSDTYFVAIADDECVCRHWYGWGKHPDSIGNWGNFRTAKHMQGNGIGGKVLKQWLEDKNNRNDLPLALLCSCGTPSLAAYYSQYGFRPALAGTEIGPLYCPLEDSPETFDSFCDSYYRPAAELICLTGSVGYRHEIDCLLNFALQAHQIPFGLPSMPTYEMALLLLAQDPAAGILERFATPQGHTVGWAFTPRGQKKEIQIHPAYR